MDDQRRKRKSEKYQEKKKKKKKRREEEHREREEAQLPISHRHLAALSSATGDAAVKQKRKEKKARKMLLLRDEDASTEQDRAEEPFSGDDKKASHINHSGLKVEELEDQHFEAGDMHRRNDKEDKKRREEEDGNLQGEIVNEGKMKTKKKKKKREVKDVEVCLHTEIDKEQDPDQEKNGEEEEEYRYFKEGNLLRENNEGEEKRSEKKKRKRREEEVEKAGLQEIRADHEQGNEKKARKLLHSAKETGVGKNIAEEDVCDEVTTSAMNINPSDMDLRQEGNGKEKKKTKTRKTVRFQDPMIKANQEWVRNFLNEGPASENSKEVVEEIWGVRFTSEEDEILKEAVWKYIKSKGWDEHEGLNKVLNSHKHKDARNCWADIKLCLPHRPRQAVRYRAHLLLGNSTHSGKWSKEEEELLKRLQERHGHKWKEISSLIDRHRVSIKEKWRTLKRPKGTGVWTQDELQQLSDMVHKCLSMKASLAVENKKPTRHILRDDINWETIAETIGTHGHGSCCSKWYYNLQSSLVADGLWANEDDSLLLRSLLESGACAEEELEWDSLLAHRSGQVCSTRWKQMVKHLGENRTRQFLDKLDALARRYAPELLG